MPYNPQTGKYDADPNADQALTNLSNRYVAGARYQASQENPELFAPAPSNAPGGETGAIPTGGQPTVSGWQGGVYHWPNQGQSAGDRYAASRRSSGGSRSSQSYSAGSVAPVIPEPTYNPPEAPKMPTFTAREYSPPEEDVGYERAKRRELMGAGSRELRQRTQEAVVGSRSLSNPAARKDFVRSALAGYGSGLEKVARGAQAGATAAARQKRAEQITIYNSQYSALSGADKVNYQNEINRLAQDYASKQWGAQEAYSTQKSAYLNQPQINIHPGSGAIPDGSTTSSRMKEWYDRQLNAPNIGYFGM